MSIVKLVPLMKEFMDALVQEIKEKDAKTPVYEGDLDVSFYNSSALPGLLYDGILISTTTEKGALHLMPENNYVPVTEAGKTYTSGNNDPKDMFLQAAEGFIALTGLKTQPQTIVNRMPSFQHS